MFSHQSSPTSLSSLRLVATGLNGTLLRPDLTLSTYTREVLQRLQASGVTIILLSARPPRTIRPIAQSAGIGGLALCSNGAILYNLDEERIVHEQKLSPEHIDQLIHQLQDVDPALTFAVETGTLLACEEAWYTSCAPPAACLPSIVHRATLWQEPQIKLLVHHPRKEASQLYAQLSPFIDLTLYSLTYSGPQFVEIAPATVQKGTALAALCRQLAIPATSVVAFGDMPNDIPMLKWAGLGIALANAHPSVKQIADITAPSNEEDGCAQLLEKLLTASQFNEDFSNPSSLKQQY